MKTHNLKNGDIVTEYTPEEIMNLIEDICLCLNMRVEEAYYHIDEQLYPLHGTLVANELKMWRAMLRGCGVKMPGEE